MDWDLSYSTTVQLRNNGFWDPDEPVDLVNRGWLEPPAKGIHGKYSYPTASNSLLIEDNKLVRTSSRDIANCLC